MTSVNTKQSPTEQQSSTEQEIRESITKMETKIPSWNPTKPDATTPKLMREASGEKFVELEVECKIFCNQS